MRGRCTAELVTILALSGGVMLAGCDSSGGAKKAAVKPTATQPVTTASPTSGPKPIEKPQEMTRTQRAELREQALGLLVNTALAGSPEERANAMEALTQTPARLAIVLDTGLQDQSAGVRAVAALAAGKTKQSAFVGKIRPLLQDPSSLVRSGAMYALRRCGADVDLTPLAEMLADSAPKNRAQAAFVLGELGEKSALGPLREAAKESMSRANPAEVRLMDLQIAEARVKLGDEAAIADIRTALYPSRPEDLEAAVFAMQIIGQVKDRASVNRLIQMTVQTDETKQVVPGEIRMAAAMALARLGQPQGSFIAREYFAGEKETLRAQSAHLFGETGNPDNLHILARMMNDPDGRVRVAACSAIVKVTSAEGRNGN